MKKTFAVLSVFLLCVSAAMAASRARPELVGRWSLNGQPFCVFKADGTGSMQEEIFRWEADGRILVLSGEEGNDRVPYRLENGKLYLSLGGMELGLDRAGKTGNSSGGRDENRSSAKAGTSSAPARKESASNAGKLESLLLSSAWCSFTYNKHSGTTQTSRVRFFPDGTWKRGARRETYSSGDYGTVSGQHDSGDGGRWKVEGERLYLSSPPEAPGLEPVDLRVASNSNGYPILTVDGKEYSSCE